MRFMMPRAQRGLTLIELMVGLSIGALLAMSAAPFFGDYVTNSRLREGGNVLLSEALAAQSEAIKRNVPVRLSTSGSTVRVISLEVPATPVVLRERVLPGALALPTGTLDFGTEGRPTPFGSSGAFNVTSTAVSCSGDYRCPGLRVDAGGAIRLCGNYLSGCT